jgi:hypothetical protein
MALDDSGAAAVKLLLFDRACGAWLRAPGNPQNKQNLRNFLDDRSDAERSDYDEIIAAAADSLNLANRPAEPAGRDGGGSIVKRTAYDADIITAPFRFIDLPDQVAPPETADPVALDDPIAGYFCATIDYNLVAESPLLIGAPDAKKADGAKDSLPVLPVVMGGARQHVIPGSTMRGMIRAACETVGFAKLARGNWHHRFGLRDFNHRKYKEQSVSRVSEVGSGFLRIRKAVKDDLPRHVIDEGPDEGMVYEIAPCAKPWAPIQISELARYGIAAPTEMKAPGDKLWINLDLAEKYRRAGMLKGAAPEFSKTIAVADLPHPKDGYGAREVGFAPAGRPGVPVFAGRFPGKGNKKVEYVFFPDADATPVPLSREMVKLFIRLHAKPSRSRPEPLENWKLMREAAQSGGAPVFYVGDPASRGDGFFFGLTRLFKIPHLNSVAAVLADTQPEHLAKAKFAPNKDGKPQLSSYNDDFVERLFGYVIEPGDVMAQEETDSHAPDAIARKSRVAFSFAALDPSTPVKVADPVTIVQMAPRASFAPFYLRSDGRAAYEKDYSVKDVRLAGRKAYFPRYAAPAPGEALRLIAEAGKAQIEQIKESSTRGRSDGRDTWSHLRFLMPASERLLVFNGRIRLHNVSAAEIGLVLFALTHGGDCDKRFRHMAGRARPFGAGQMRLGAIKLALDPNTGEDARMMSALPQERFDAASGKGLSHADGHSIAPFLEAFTAHMKKTVPAFPAVAPVEEWLGMADPALGAAAAHGLVYQGLKSFKAIRDMFLPLPEGSRKPEPKERLLPAPRR